MKPDYELLRNILEHIEEVSDRQERHTISRDTFPDSLVQCESFDILSFCFDILCLNGFVEGMDLGEECLNPLFAATEVVSGVHVVEMDIAFDPNRGRRPRYGWDSDAAA